MNYIYRFTVILFCLIAPVFSSCFANVPDSQTKPVDGIVAIVNNQVITRSQLDQAVDSFSKIPTNASQDTQSLAFQRMVLNELIDKKLELQIAQRMKIKVSDQQLEQVISGIATRNKMSLAELKTALTNQGVDFNYYQQQIKEQIMIQEAINQAVGQHITITEQDIKNAKHNEKAQTEQQTLYQLGDILIPLPENPSNQAIINAQEKAEKIIAQFQQGTDFNTLAAKYSANHNPQSTDWKSLSDLPSAFAQQVKLMKTHEVSQPIRTGNGFHLIQLQGKKSPQSTHYVTQTHVRHILIKTNLPSDNKPAEDQLLSIRQQIVQGASFAKMAKLYSQDPGSSIRGGDLGWVSPGELVPNFQAAMDHLPINKISNPVKTRYGWHLIEVLGRRKVNDSKAYQQAQIKQKIYQQQLDKKSKIWLEQLRNTSYIKILL